MKTIISVITVVAISHVAFGQYDGQSYFTDCINAASGYLIKQCGAIESSQVDLYNKCLCYGTFIEQ